jgi:A/G-specific adenine glycosylase
MKETTADSAVLDPAARDALRAALLGYYDRHARDLPWRRDTDPYRILVSEIMLQQTRVETVKGYYDPWLERFPTLESLAVADEDEVLKAWEGLGYYRRARNLHRAARAVRESPGGSMPDDYEALRALPGVGEYTAGAVASIAFGEAVPAVDGNVKRVFARLFDVSDPRPAWLRTRASELVDQGRPGDWNQALMELGATVCTPRAPKCSGCPVAEWCAALANGTQLERPTRPVKKAVPTADVALAVVHDGERVLLGKRRSDGLLGGMWAFPERRLDEAVATSVGPDARDGVQSIVGLLDLRPSAAFVELPECNHRFTHLAARYLPFAVDVSGDLSNGVGRPVVAPASLEELGITETAWVDSSEVGDKALPRAQQKILASWLELLPEAV